MGIGSAVIVVTTWSARIVPLASFTSAAMARADGLNADLSLRTIVPDRVAVADAGGGTTVRVTPLVGPPVITGVGSSVWSVRDPSATVAYSA